MGAALKDYRSADGLSRRQEEETVLRKYIRVAEVGAPQLNRNYPLPIARPIMAAGISMEDYELLLDVLDELFVLEAAARYTDRKSAEISRRRLYRAIARECGCRAKDIEGLLVRFGPFSTPVLRRVAKAILPNRAVADQSILDGAYSPGDILPFSPR